MRGNNIFPDSGAARLHPGYMRCVFDRSPDEAQRNPGCVCISPDSGAARLHPGYMKKF